LGVQLQIYRPLFLVTPAILLVALLGFLGFSLTKISDKQVLEAKDDAEIARTVLTVGEVDVLAIDKLYFADAQAFFNGADVTTWLEKNVKCSTLDGLVTSNVDYFTYQRRMSAVEKVTSKATAQTFFYNNSDWAYPADFALAYTNKSVSYITEQLKKTKRDLDVNQANWNAIAFELLPTSVKQCGLEDVYQPTLAALSDLDSAIAEAANHLVR
jgi:hypothetical protein